MFHSTRLKLTAWYLLIIMLVSVTFSVVIYNVLMHEVERFDQLQRLRIMRHFGEYDPELVGEVRNRIISALFLVNTGIFALAGIFGYVLAGRTLKPIQNMMDEQNRFISDASHELRTPLTSLKAAFEVYGRQTKHTQEEASELVNGSLHEVDRLIALSQSLLQLTEISAPTAKMIMKPIQLTEILKETLKMMGPIAKQKSVHIIHMSTTSIVMGNYLSLVELFSILLENAIKYSPPGSNVVVSTPPANKMVTVTIEDHGIGIPASDIPHIFDRFYRADTARTSAHISGYGLGLSIAKKIVDTHKGTIAVASTPGKGTTFTLRLPSASLQSRELH